MQLRDFKTSQKVQGNRCFGLVFLDYNISISANKIISQEIEFLMKHRLYLGRKALCQPCREQGTGSHLHSLPGMWGRFPHWAHREAFVSHSLTAKSVQASVWATVPLSQLLHKNYLGRKYNVNRVFIKASWWGHYLNFLLESTGWHMLAFKSILWTHFL